MKKLGYVLLGLLAGTIVWGAASQVRAAANDDAEIKALEERIAVAAKARDVDAIMKNFVPDQSLVVFDVIPPRQYVGAEAYKKDWQGFLAGFDGPITWEISDLSVASDGKMAFAHYISHSAGKDKNGKPIDVTTRNTDVLRKIKGKWLIVHEHISVPVDIATGKADLSAKP